MNILLSVLALATGSTLFVSFNKQAPDSAELSADAQVCPDTHAWTGKYRNFSYGFTIVIPDGYKGFWNSAKCVSDGKNCTCMSDHGRIIPLSAEPYEEERLVEVYASHGAELEEPTVAEAVKQNLHWIRSRSKPDTVAVLKQVRVVVSGKPGRRVLVRYYDKKIQRWFFEDFVKVLKDGDEFSLYLRTPRENYAEDNAVFAAILASFRFEKSDLGPIEADK